MANAILAVCSTDHKQTILKGTVLLEEGAWSGRLYVLAEGSVDILRGNTVVASINEPGSILGEMAMLLGVTHSATVRAHGNCVVYAIEDGAAFVRSNPEIAFEIAQNLAKRLHNATSYIVDLNESAKQAGNIWAW